MRLTGHRVSFETQMSFQWNAVQDGNALWICSDMNGVAMVNTSRRRVIPHHIKLWDMVITENAIAAAKRHRMHFFYVE